MMDDMMEDMSMEDVAMNGSKIEKKAMVVKKKKMKELRKVKQAIGVEDSWNDEPLEAMEVVKVLMNLLKGLKSPVAKDLFGKAHKGIVNGVIDAATSAKSIAKDGMDDMLKKI